MNIHQLICIFCEIDDFCKEFDKYMQSKLLPSNSTGKRGPRCRLSDSEIMVILIAFQPSNFRHFKRFYLGFVCKYWAADFPFLPSYNRFIELMSRVTMQLTLFSKLRQLENLQGLAFGDKGYVGKQLFDRLFQKGMKLITRVRKNMKSKPMTGFETHLLNQRGIIETVIGHLKHHYQVWHTRHRSLINAMTHLVAAIASYVIEPLKISAIKSLNSNNV